MLRIFKEPLQVDRSDCRAFIKLSPISLREKKVLQFGDELATSVNNLQRLFVSYRTRIKDYQDQLEALADLIFNVVKEQLQCSSMDIVELKDRLISIQTNFDIRILENLKCPYGIQFSVNEDSPFTYNVTRVACDYDQNLNLTKVDREHLPELLSEIRNTSFRSEEEILSKLLSSEVMQLIEDLEERLESGTDLNINSILGILKVEHLASKYCLPEEVLNLDKFKLDLDRALSLSCNSGEIASLEDFKSTSRKKKVFIVHGRNEDSKKKVKKLVSDLGLEPIILHEQVSEGRTIFENFALHSDVGSAIVIYDGDDSCILTEEVKGKQVPREKLAKRPRPNVILEHGYLTAKLGRDRIVMLVTDPEIDLPTDILGVTYIPMQGTWRAQVKDELIAMNLNVK